MYSGDTSITSDSSRAYLESFNCNQLSEESHEESFFEETEKWLGRATHPDRNEMCWLYTCNETWISWVLCQIIVYFGSFHSPSVPFTIHHQLAAGQRFFSQVMNVWRVPSTLFKCELNYFRSSLFRSRDSSNICWVLFIWLRCMQVWKLLQLKDNSQKPRSFWVRHPRTSEQRKLWTLPHGYKRFQLKENPLFCQNWDRMVK